MNKVKSKNGTPNLAVLLSFQVVDKTEKGILDLTKALFYMFYYLI